MEGRIVFGDIVSYTGEGISDDSVQELLEVRLKGRREGQTSMYFCEGINDVRHKTFLVVDGKQKITTNRDGNMIIL